MNKRTNKFKSSTERNKVDTERERGGRESKGYSGKKNRLARLDLLSKKETDENAERLTEKVLRER